MANKISIKLGNTFMKIGNYDPDFFIKVIKRFCVRNLSKITSESVPGTNIKRSVISHTFARRNLDECGLEETRMSVQLYDQFMDYARSFGYKNEDFIISNLDVIVGVPVEFEWKGGWGVPRPNQEDWVQYQSADGPIKINNAQTGFGKGQPVDSLILTPTGWRRIGDLKVADEVINWEGTISKVLGVYPQGKKNLYTLTTEDNREPVVDEEHLWTVFDPLSKTWSEINTLTFYERFKNNKEFLSLPLFKGVIKEKLSYDLEPYLFGYFLLREFKEDNLITLKAGVDKLPKDLEQYLPESYYFESPKPYQMKIVHEESKSFLDEFKHLLNLNKDETSISLPDEYLEGDKEQLLSLLRGLFDSIPNTFYFDIFEFNTKSIKLAEQLRNIIFSIGGKCKIKETVIDNEIFYNLNIRLVGLTLDETVIEDKLKVVNIVPSGEGETVCIKIDHPDQLYVTKDYVVTHNTFMATHTMVTQGERTLVTCLPKYQSIWINNFDEKLVMKPEDLLLIDNSDLDVIAEKIFNKEIQPKIIILPLTRLSIYLNKTKEDPTLPSLDEVYERMGIGLRIMDESHESIHQVYISLMYGNFNKIICLSATLSHDVDFNNKIYEYMFPLKYRHKDPEYLKYIDVYAYWHSIDLQKYRIRTKSFAGYSHVAFEKSILKSQKLFNRYADLCVRAFKEFYLEHEDYEPDQKCLFFFSSVEMCKRMLAYFKQKFPDLDLYKFTNDESKNKLLANSYNEHQVVFTTEKSCGTGKDIERLFVCISPLCVSSSQVNNQMLGRLRDVSKWWKDKTPKYVFFVCKDILKQKEYARKRKEIFANKSKGFYNINSQHYI